MLAFTCSIFSTPLPFHSQCLLRVGFATDQFAAVVLHTANGSGHGATAPRAERVQETPLRDITRYISVFHLVRRPVCLGIVWTRASLRGLAPMLSMYLVLLFLYLPFGMPSLRGVTSASAWSYYAKPHLLEAQADRLPKLLRVGPLVIVRTSSIAVGTVS